MESPSPILPTPRASIFPLTPEREAQQREDVIKSGMRFERTPYRQWGNSVGGGIDCAMLLVRGWVDGGIFEEFDPRPYPPEWHLHNDQERYLEWMASLAKEVVIPRRGDIVLYRFGRCFSHSGLVLGPNLILHSYVKDGLCSQCEMNTSELMWMKDGKTPRPRKFFDVWAKLREVEELV